MRVNIKTVGLSRFLAMHASKDAWSHYANEFVLLCFSQIILISEDLRNITKKTLREHEYTFFQNEEF